MKTAEEILLTEVFGDFLKQLPENDHILNAALKAMKIYANQKLDIVADCAEVEINYRYNINGDPHYQVNQDSILNFKDKL